MIYSYDALLQIHVYPCCLFSVLIIVGLLYSFKLILKLLIRLLFISVSNARTSTCNLNLKELLRPATLKQVLLFCLTLWTMLMWAHLQRILHSLPKAKRTIKLRGFFNSCSLSTSNKIQISTKQCRWKYFYCVPSLNRIH